MKPFVAHEFTRVTPGFSGIRVARSYFSMQCFVDHCLSVLLYLFFWSLYCLSFFDLRLLVTPFGIFNICLFDYTVNINERINGMHSHTENSINNLSSPPVFSGAGGF